MPVFAPLPQLLFGHRRRDAEELAVEAHRPFTYHLRAEIPGTVRRRPAEMSTQRRVACQSL